MRQLIIFIIICFATTSCSSLFSKRIDVIHIKSNEAVNLVVENDSINSLLMDHTIIVERANKNLSIKLYNDSLEKTLSIYSRYSFIFWLNFLSPYGTGFLFDMNTPKKYDYPALVSVNINDNTHNFYNYNVNNPILTHSKNSFKLTPLKALGLFNPSIQLSYERKLSNHFSLQLGGGFLLPTQAFVENVRYIPHRKGYTSSIEGRYYLNHMFAGTYLSMSFDYLNSNHQEFKKFIYPPAFPNSPHPDAPYFDTTTVLKQTFTTNFKIGYQQVINHFVFDFYAGLGLRFKQVKYEDMIHEEATEVYFRDSYLLADIFERSNWKGFSNTISIPLNFKVGYLF